MPHITYNVIPNHPAGGNRIHWVISLVEGYRTLSSSTASIRVTRELVSNRVTYNIRNVDSKINASAHGDGDQITLRFFELGMPEPRAIYYPHYREPYLERSFSLHDGNGIAEAAKCLATELDRITDYSTGEYARIKFSITPQFNKNIYQGGKIISYDYDPNTRRTIVELESANHIKSGIVFNTEINGKRDHSKMVGLYIILDELDKFVVITPLVMGLYYREIVT